MIQVHPDIERAAVISGVGKQWIMLRVLAPILRTQIINGWLLVFAHAMRDVGIPLIFLTSKTVMMSSALWLMWGYPDVPGDRKSTRLNSSHVATSYAVFCLKNNKGEYTISEQPYYTPLS